MAQGVAHPVLQGPGQGFRLPPHHHRFGNGQLHPFALLRPLEGPVRGDALQKGLQIHRLLLRAQVPQLLPGQVQELADHLPHPPRLPLDAVQVGLPLGGAVLAGQGRRQTHPLQGGPKLVGDVPQQTALGGHQGLDPLRHGVEGPPQLGDLVPPIRHLRPHPGGQIPPRQGGGGPAQVPQGHGEPPDQQEAQGGSRRHGQEKAPQGVPKPRGRRPRRTGGPSLRGQQDPQQPQGGVGQGYRDPQAMPREPKHPLPRGAGRGLGAFGPEGIGGGGGQEGSLRVRHVQLHSPKLPLPPEERRQGLLPPLGAHPPRLLRQGRHGPDQQAGQPLDHLAVEPLAGPQGGQLEEPHGQQQGQEEPQVHAPEEGKALHPRPSGSGYTSTYPSPRMVRIRSVPSG